MEGYRSGHNGAVLKTVRAASSQGFESLTLRQKCQKMINNFISWHFLHINLSVLTS